MTVEVFRPAGQEVPQNPVLRFMTPVGEMIYNRRNHAVLSPLVGATKLTLTEGVIFDALMTQPESTITYDDLAKTLWNTPQASGAQVHTMHVYATRLRVRLEDKSPFQLIHTVPNVGYSLTDPAQGWEHFKSREIITCETPIGEVRYRLPEMTVFSPLLGHEVQLTPTENAFFKKLIAQPDRIHAAEEIAKEVWGFSAVGKAEKHMLRIVVGLLRKKLGENDAGNPRLVVNTKNKGYSLIPPVNPDLIGVDRRWIIV